MKKTVLITAALSLCLAFSSTAQTLPEVEQLYSRHSSGEGVFAMNLNKEMLDAVDMDFDWDDQMKHITGDIYQVKFITFSESKLATTKIRELDAEMKKLSLKEIKIPADKTDSDLKFARIFGDKHGEYYKNVVMLILTEENIGFFVALNGNLKVENQ